MQIDVSTPRESVAPVRTFEHLAAEGVFDSPGWLLDARRAAIEAFAAAGYPGPSDEDWRFTDLTALKQLPFRPVLQARKGVVADVTPFLVPGIEGHRLVFVDGHYCAPLSVVHPEPGVTLGPLAELIARDDPRVRETFGRLATREPNPFALLNTAFARDGVFLDVEPGREASPIHLIFLSTGSEEGATAHLRNLIRVGRGARAAVFETYAALGEDHPTVTNAMAEVLMDEHSVFEHVKLQEEAAVAIHMATVAAEMSRSALHRYHSLASGAAISRTMIHAILAGEGVESDLNGLYLPRTGQLADHFMIVEHAAPHCASHEHFSGILSGRGRGVFHGRIRVQPGAQKTDAKQTNRNLLLSDEATVNAKPQLEIYADDVKCTHGATVGQLNEEAIFYLRSRGIGHAEARRILVHAFAGEILDRIQCEPVHAYLNERISSRLTTIPELISSSP